MGFNRINMVIVVFLLQDAACKYIFGVSSLCWRHDVMLFSVSVDVDVVSKRLKCYILRRNLK